MPTIKLLIVGPKEAGKTSVRWPFPPFLLDLSAVDANMVWMIQIANFLAEQTDRLGGQDRYQPTMGVRYDFSTASFHCHLYHSLPYIK
jgi:intraflagellar transport protein 22